MITLRKYQEEAVHSLLKDTYSLLAKPGGRHKMVLKAPTGAGKTVTMAAFLNQLCNELPDRLELPRRQIAFIWFAPNQLHLQSYFSLKDYFAELRTIKPIQFEDISDGQLKPNEMLFVNWQSVNKKNNLFIKENEQGQDLITFVENAAADEIEIICILDEAHYHAAGKKAKALLQKLNAKIEIDVSATPLLKSDYGYIIKRDEVIEAEMIKKNVVLNPALDHHKQEGRSLNQVLLEEALNKRNELAKAYKTAGTNINPLLLVQLPNENKTESVLDKEIIDEVETFLDYKGITTKNGQLAVWLSNKKTNLEDIEDHNSLVNVLLFKQAIALGWDCPRASILLIFREIKQNHFGIQTVGRILRMPEQKHYTNPMLNNGYVYTNLSKDVIYIVQEDMDYIVQNKAKRVEGYQPLALESEIVKTRLVRNRLTSKFRKCLYEAAEEYFGLTKDPSITGGYSIDEYNAKQLASKFIEINVNNIEIPIPKDLELIIVEGATRVDEKERFAKTSGELSTLFRQFCRDNVGRYAKVDSVPVLEMAMKLLFEDYLFMHEFNAVKVVLLSSNKPKFIELIDLALHKHEFLLKEEAAKKTRPVEKSQWDVPPERIYNEQYKQRDAKMHALEPFYESVKASNPEQHFATFLEQNKEHIDWWYKNGDQNKEDFSIAYKDANGNTSGFYVDFVIRLKNGTVALFDTKTLDSDLNFVQKHNALHRYVKEKSTSTKPLIGGVIVPREKSDYTIWKYPENLIRKADDYTGWSTFEPSRINKMN